MKHILAVLTALALAVAFSATLRGSATHVYLAQSAAGSADGSSCVNARAYTYFNSAGNWGSGATQIGAGTTVHLCGTITGSANGSGLVFQGSGSSGSPVTLKFETGAVLTAPYWASSLGGTAAGGIVIGPNRSYIVIDGGTNGLIRNTANGSGRTYQVDSTGISGLNCDNCEIKNLTISDIYVNTQGDGTLGSNSGARAIDVTGSNWSLHSLSVDDCGWCLMLAYENGDTNYRVYDNTFTNFGHGIALATSSPGAACTAPCFTMTNNHFGDTANWSAPDCPFHQDGLHSFGWSGSTIAGVYVSNNYFEGDYGTCPTGHIFVEAGTYGAGMSSSYWWNNVFIIPDVNVENTNGWFGAFGLTGTAAFYNNTVIGPNTTDDTLCVGIYTASVTFENNVISNCGNPLAMTSVTIASVGKNLYGNPCLNGADCFAWNGSYTGSFAAWKAASGADATSVSSATPLLNAAGVPQTGSPAIGLGVNRMSVATGLLASLALDTTLGGTRTAQARPASGAWWAGAYAGTGAAVAPNAPTNVRIR